MFQNPLQLHDIQAHTVHKLSGGWKLGEGLRIRESAALGSGSGCHRYVEHLQSKKFSLAGKTRLSLLGVVQLQLRALANCFFSPICVTASLAIGNTEVCEA